MTFNPYNNRIPTELLSQEEIAALIKHAQLEYWHTDLGWKPREDPDRELAPSTIYRAVQPKLNLPWSSINPKWQWATKVPQLDSVIKFFDTDPKVNGSSPKSILIPMCFFNDPDPYTLPWEQSLTQRPK